MEIAIENLKHYKQDITESEKAVEKVYEQALSADATSVKAPQKTSWSGYHGYFKDLDGHLWEIAYNPFFWVGPENKDV